MITGLFWLIIGASPWLLLGGALLLVAAVFGGFTSIAKIIATVLSIFAGIVEFFREDTARKVIAIVIAVVVGCIAGEFHGKYEERAAWKAEENIMRARIKSLDGELSSLNARLQDEEKKRTPKFDVEIGEYETAIKKQPNADACDFTDDDLRWLRQFRR